MKYQGLLLEILPPNTLLGISNTDAEDQEGNELFILSIGLVVITLNWIWSK